MASRATLATIEAAAIERHLASPWTMARLAQSSCGGTCCRRRGRAWACTRAAHRLRHRPERGVEDVVAVDAVDVGDADADPRRGQDVRGRASRRASAVERLAVGDAVRDIAAGSSTTAAATTRPRQAGRGPTSSTPAIGPAVNLELDSFQLEGRLHRANRFSPFGRASRYRRALSKQRQLPACGDRALKQVGPQLQIALIEAQALRRQAGSARRSARHRGRCRAAAARTAAT